MHRAVALVIALVVLGASTAARAQAPVHASAADAAVEPVGSEPVESEPMDSAPEAAADGESMVKAGEGRTLRDGGRLGLALLGGGAALAASTAALSSLIEALSRDDRDANAPPKNPELVQVSGFVSVSLMSASVGVMLFGGALLANDLVDAPSPP